MYDVGTNKIDGYRLVLHRNENFLIDHSVLQSLAKEALSIVNLTAYPDPESLELRSAIAKKHNVTPDCIFVGNTP